MSTSWYTLVTQHSAYETASPTGSRNAVMSGTWNPEGRMGDTTALSTYCATPTAACRKDPSMPPAQHKNLDVHCTWAALNRGSVHSCDVALEGSVSGTELQARAHISSHAIVVQALQGVVQKSLQVK